MKHVMLKKQRHREILQSLERQGAARVVDLAQLLGVDPVTVRRDLAELEAAGCLQRVHGGALARDQALRSNPPSPIVRRIAEATARTIADGSVVFLGPGAITAEVVTFLQGHPPLTVITNALNIAWAVARQERHTLYVVGGQLGAAYGLYPETPDVLRRLRLDYVVLEADRVDAERGITVEDQEVATMARRLFAIGAQHVVLVRPTHLGRTAPLFVAPASEADILITGREARNAPLWDLSELGTQVILA